MAMPDAPSARRYDPPPAPPTAGRQLTDAICVAVLAAGLWLTASAVARVSARGLGLVDCQTPVAQASPSPVPGVAALAECGDKTANPAAEAPKPAEPTTPQH
jgi:hypothetical protein